MNKRKVARQFIEISKKILINWRSLYGLVQRLYLFTRALERHIIIKILLLKLLQIAGYAVMLVGSLAVVPFVNYAIMPEQSLKQPFIARLHEFITTHTSFNFIIVLAAGSICLLFFARISQSLADYTSQKLETTLRIYYESKLYYHFIRLNPLLEAEGDVTDIIHAVKVRLPSILNNFVNPFLDLLHTVVYLAIGLTLLYLSDPSLVLFAILPITVFLFLSMYLTNDILKKLAMEVDQESLIQGSKMLESLIAREYIQILGKEGIFAKVYKETLAKVEKAKLKTYLIISIFRPASEILIYSTLVLLILYVLIIFQQSDLTKITVFVVIVYRILPQANNLFLIYSRLKQGVVFFDASAKDLLLALSQRTDYQQHAKNPLPFNHHIRLENVSCSYGKEGEHAEVLQDINMEIGCGMMVGICGESGSGKTTLLKILLGMLLPQRGRMLIDDKPFSPRLKRRWQDNLGYVSQNTILLKLSVKENIALASKNEEIDMKRIEEVIHLSESWNFVSKLPQGIDTPLSSLGTKLSGGQKQRLVIARSLYTRPGVLILDEATSALDKKTENKIMQNISKSIIEKTLIMVTHRLDTIKNSDIIFFMKDGRIAGQGSYDELMKNEEFRSLTSNANLKKNEEKDDK